MIYQWRQKAYFFLANLYLNLLLTICRNANTLKFYILFFLINGNKIYNNLGNSVSVIVITMRFEITKEKKSPPYNADDTADLLGYYYQLTHNVFLFVAFSLSDLIFTVVRQWTFMKPKKKRFFLI